MKRAGEGESQGIKFKLLKATMNDQFMLCQYTLAHSFIFLPLLCIHTHTQVINTGLEEGAMLVGNESDYPFTPSVVTPELEPTLYQMQISEN